MEYLEALTLSQKFKKILEPACERIMPVGSVRRGDEKVQQKGCHDIEFLIIQKEEKAGDMFGHPLPDDQQLPSPLERVIASMLESGSVIVPKRPANGQKYKKFAIPGCEYIDADGEEKQFCLELWIVTERTWGIQAVIRTGPSEFSYKFVNSEEFIGEHKPTGKRLRGLLPNYYEYIKGETKIVIRRTGEEVDTHTEEQALRLLGINSSNNYWIEPSERFRYTAEEKSNVR